MSLYLFRSALHAHVEMGSVHGVRSFVLQESRPLPLLQAQEDYAWASFGFSELSSAFQEF